jgi:hypothetical protein
MRGIIAAAGRKARRDAMEQMTLMRAAYHADAEGWRKLQQQYAMSEVPEGASEAETLKALGFHLPPEHREEW